LLRRLTDADFDRQDYRLAARRPLALLGSALAFGALHRSFVAGAIAGVVYGLMLLPRGRLSDAVIAHMVTNALLVGYAVTGGDWRWAV
jgi:membrane protease YdiL (CAAX protease family)